MDLLVRIVDFLKENFLEIRALNSWVEYVYFMNCVQKSYSNIVDAS